MELTNSSAIVTGGASGIGAAAARLLAKKGAKVVIADLQADKGEALAKEIGGAFCKVDVTNTQDIINATEMAKSMGPIRALVNSAGIGWAQRTVGKDGTVESAANLDAFKKVIAINLVGTFDCIRVVATAMSRNEPLEHGERGAIVNIASVAGKDGNPNASAYSTSKAAVIGFTKSLGKELADTEVRVNCVTPAAVKTAIFDQMTPEHIQFMLSKIPMGRFGEVQEAAALVAWLASADCSFSTGAVFDLSGGRATY